MACQSARRGARWMVREERCQAPSQPGGRWVQVTVTPCAWQRESRVSRVGRDTPTGYCAPVTRFVARGPVLSGTRSTVQCGVG